MSTYHVRGLAWHAREHLGELYLIDPEADRFPYGARELRGRSLRRLRAMNRDGFTLARGPGFGIGTGPDCRYHLYAWIERSLFAAVLSVSVLAAILSILAWTVPGWHASSVSVVGPVVTLVCAGIAWWLNRRDWAKFTKDRHWYPITELMWAIDAKRVTQTTTGQTEVASGLASEVRTAWKELTSSPEWRRIGPDRRSSYISQVDQLLWEITLIAAAPTLEESGKMLAPTREKVAGFLVDVRHDVDPARTVEQAIRELQPEGFEPDHIEMGPHPGMQIEAYPYSGKDDTR